MTYCIRASDEHIKYFHEHGYLPYYDGWEQIQVEGGVSYPELVCWLQFNRNIFVDVTSTFNKITGLYREFTPEILKGEYDSNTKRYVERSLSFGPLSPHRHLEDCYQTAVGYVVKNDLLSKNS